MTTNQIKHIDIFLICFNISQSVHYFKRTCFICAFYELKIDQIDYEEKFEEFDCLCILVAREILEDLENHHSIDGKNESAFFVTIETQEESEEEGNDHVFQMRICHQQSVQPFQNQ